MTTADPRHETFNWLATNLSDRRLDWDKAVSLAIDVFEAEPSTVLDREATTSRELLKEHECFRYLQNAGMAVKALDLLRARGRSEAAVRRIGFDHPSVVQRGFVVVPEHAR